MSHGDYSDQSSYDTLLTLFLAFKKSCKLKNMIIYHMEIDWIIWFEESCNNFSSNWV